MLRVATVTRKPLAGSVVQNALRHGTGGLNIESARIGTTDNLNGGAYSGGSRPTSAMGCTGEAGGTSSMLEAGGGRLQPAAYQQPTRRWPANCALMHPPDCRCVGTRKVATGTAIGAGASSIYGTSMDDKGGGTAGYASPDGTETIEAWDCAPGCPVAELDRQSAAAGMHSAGSAQPPRDKWSPQKTPGWGNIGTGACGARIGDIGGASRFFKQIVRRENDMPTTIPQDLVDYLLDLISPPPPALRAIYVPTLEGLDLSETADLSVTGMIARGTPTEEQAKELLRVLLPGAHLVLIAPDENPVGDLGACVIEDTGFEIRDSILLVDEDQYFHYVPKAARAEREAGCHHLPGKSGAEAVDREEGTASVVHNFHPTVKPIELMERLLADVPLDQGPVVDNFCGSGSTMLACIRTGHEGIGIEKDPEYLQIATARARYMDSNFNGWVPTEVVSEAPEPPPKTFSLFAGLMDPEPDEPVENEGEAP